MLKSSVQSKIKVMACISAIEGSCVILFIIGLLISDSKLFIDVFVIYLLCRVIEKLMWRCPKCKRKLPKGNTSYINTCIYCSYKLR